MLEKYLRWHHHHPVEDATHSAGEGGEATHLGALVLTSDGLHNFIDGIIIGASYLVSIEIGIATTIAVILHEIPQEIGDFGVLIYAGYTRGKALFYNFLSALMAILGAAFVFAFSAISEWLAEAALPFAAGAFIYIAAADLVPELHRSERGKTFFIETVGMVLGLVAMYLLLFLE
jgi:zinc and cadmium transporter